MSAVHTMLRMRDVYYRRLLSCRAGVQLPCPPAHPRTYCLLTSYLLYPALPGMRDVYRLIYLLTIPTYLLYLLIIPCSARDARCLPTYLLTYYTYLLYPALPGMRDVYRAVHEINPIKPVGSGDHLDEAMHTYISYYCS